MAARPETPTPYEPAPIAEAEAFRWGELLPPTQDALYEMLVWLKAACKDSTPRDKQEHVSTSLLIHGGRGTGKTTVLLSAAHALSNPGDFFKSEGRDLGAQRRCEELKEFLLKSRLPIAWMEPLDLEPLPETANLLATILVRVRTALDKATPKTTPLPGQSSWRGSSLLEESADDPWGQLDRLIRDATFMWEDIPAATDARLRAEQQIKASEIFAEFQRSFAAAIEQVARRLAIARSSSTDNANGILVLPIDNVDRSIGHLYNIVKLTRMVTSRRLWFVMAAGHEEFQLFMERSFQKELIVSGQAGIGPKGHDETLAIARRQASTTLRRALPPSYRIGLDPVRPAEAWEFQGNSNTSPRLRELLAKLPLPPSKNRNANLESFAALFDVGPRLSGEVKEALDEDAANTDKLYLTHAARMALSLPARTLRDLWHSLDHATKRAPDEQPDHVVRIAAGMLRQAIDESALPAWASQQFHNRLLRKDVQGKLVLDLTGNPVSRARRTTLSDVLEVSRGIFPDAQPQPSSAGNGRDRSSSAVLISELHLRHIHDVILEMSDLDDPGRRTPLPANVAGWFMLLHDVLMLFEEPRVLNEDVTPYEISPELVVTLHELWVRGEKIQPRAKLDFWWSLPTWDLFIDFNLFTMQWRAFLPKIRELLGQRELLEQGKGAKYCTEVVEPLFRLVLAAWVDNICSVASDDERGLWQPWRGKSLGDGLDDYEKKVHARLGKLAHDSLTRSRDYDRWRMARVWLEQLLPQLALPEFAPSYNLVPLFAGVCRDAGCEELVRHWKDHLPRLTRLRQAMVRAVALRSSTYETLRASSAADPVHAALVAASWLEKVTQAWFDAVDEKGEREQREQEVLRRMTPLELDEREAPQTPTAPKEWEGLHS